MNDQNQTPRQRPSHNVPFRVTVGAVIAVILTSLLSKMVGGTVWTILFLLSQTTLISIIIWQACEPFADAAQWIGTTLRLPGSIRGATLDAIASSMPELFSGIFFVVLALVGTQGSAEELAEAGGEGYGATVAICAGSAVYNMILIPAICALVISFHRPNRPTIDVEDNVILRDGFWSVSCQFMLVVFLCQDEMFWWMGCALILAYIVYVYVLYADTGRYQQQLHFVTDKLALGKTDDQIVAAGKSDGLYLSRRMIQKTRAESSADKTEEALPETASVLFGWYHVPLNAATAWTVIGVATLVAATACYWLVEVTQTTADELDIPIFFVAVILAAAASSVPDTFLSIGAALRGDDDGAVANAFGSNIFDLCICLTIPLLVGSYLNGWQPIRLTQDGETMPGLVGLRILLCSLTVITLLVMWHKRQLTYTKAIVLCGLYGVFVAYAVAGSLGFQF